MKFSQRKGKLWMHKVIGLMKIRSCSRRTARVMSAGRRMTTKPQEQPKPHVCRRLFADEDDDEPKEIAENRENRFVEDLHRQHIEEFIERYNFDPRTERPLPGNFEWYERRNNNGEWERMRLPGEPEQERQRETEEMAEDISSTQGVEPTGDRVSQ